MRNFKGKIDIHMHSTASDGTWEPEEIARAAANSNVGLLAVTDHDETRNVERARTAAKSENLLFLPGLEVSSTYKGELFHILGYGIDISSESMQKMLKQNREEMEGKDEKLIEGLIKNGYKLSLEDYRSYEHKGSRGGWKALSFLIDAGLCMDVSSFFKDLFKKENGGEFPVFKTPEEIVRVIEEAGGIPILAHPYYSPSNVPVEKRLADFYEMGIKGFECYHPHHSKEIIVKCTKWCRANGAIITAGSDCHGDFIPTRHIGIPEVYLEDIYLGRLEEYII